VALEKEVQVFGNASDKCFKYSSRWDNFQKVEDCVFNSHSSFVARYETAVGDDFKCRTTVDIMSGELFLKRETHVHQSRLQHISNMAAIHTRGY